MSWSARADAYRESPAHRAGPDLDLLVDWCEPGEGVAALDVATGGGHVARRLREAGCTVVSTDPAPGMGPDVIARAEDLPFADRSFDVVACRIAAHHFADVRAAVREMARVARDRVVIQDNLYAGEQVEEAERVRDPSHVRCRSEPEWRELVAGSGLAIEQVELLEKWIELEPWLERAGCAGDDAERVRGLLAGRTEDGRVRATSVLLKARKI